MISRILILGINGGFGVLFSNLLAKKGINVSGADLADTSNSAVKCDQYIACDIRKPSKELEALAKNADVLLFCVPEHILLPALKIFIGLTLPQTLLIDTLSIKSPLQNIVTDRRNDIQHLSINPMFAPDIGFKNQNIAVISIVNGNKCQEFIKYMESWYANVVTMDIETHDRQTAITQALTHAVTIAFGDCLQHLGYDANKAWSISSPPHRLLMTLYARILGKDPDVYWEIQTDNPFASDARKALIQSLKMMESISLNQDRDEFINVLASGKKAVSDILPKLETLTKKIFREI